MKVKVFLISLLFLIHGNSISAQVTCDKFWSTMEGKYGNSQYGFNTISDCKRGCQAMQIEASNKGIDLGKDYLKNCQLNCRDCGKKLGKEK